MDFSESSARNGRMRSGPSEQFRPTESGFTCFTAQNGLIMRAVRDTMIIAPPLVISREQIDELAEKAWRCLDLTLARCRAEGRL